MLANTLAVVPPPFPGQATPVVVLLHVDDDVAHPTAPLHKSRRSLLPVFAKWARVSCMKGYLVSAGYVRRSVAVELSVDGYHLNEQVCMAE